MRRLLSIALLFLFCITIFVGYGDGSSQARITVLPEVEHTMDGVGNLKILGNRDSARLEFLRAIESDPSYAPAYYQLGKMFLMENSLDSALYYSELAYALDTTNLWYLRNYGQVTLMKEHYATSMKLYDKMLRMQPRDINAYRIKALLLQRESKHEEAIALLDSAELMVGHNQFLRAIKRQLYIGTNQTQKAIDELREAIDQMPYDPSNHIALGDIYSQVGADSLAERSFKWAYRLDSLSAETLASIANFYQRRGDRANYLYYLEKVIQSDQFNEEAKVELARELSQDIAPGRYDLSRVEALLLSVTAQYPANDQALMLYLRHLYARGTDELVLPVLKGIVNRGDATLNTYKLLINMLSQNRSVDSVKVYIDRALVEFPEQNSFHFDWIYTLSHEGMYQRSIDYIEQKITQLPDSMRLDLLGMLASQYEQLATSKVEGESESESNKRYKSSIKMCLGIYKAILKRDKENIMVMNNLAYTLSEHGGNLKYAEQLARRVMESDSENAVYIDTHGWILYKLGNLEQAKTELRRAMTLDKNGNAEILLHFAEVLLALDEEVLSNHYFEKAKEAGASDELIDRAKRSGAEVRSSR